MVSIPKPPSKNRSLDYNVIAREIVAKPLGSVTPIRNDEWAKRLSSKRTLKIYIGRAKKHFDAPEMGDDALRRVQYCLVVFQIMAPVFARFPKHRKEIEFHAKRTLVLRPLSFKQLSRWPNNFDDPIDDALSDFAQINPMQAYAVARGVAELSRAVLEEARRAVVRNRFADTGFLPVVEVLAGVDGRLLDPPEPVDPIIDPYAKPRRPGLRGAAHAHRH